MTLDQIKSDLLSISEVSKWPEMQALLQSVLQRAPTASWRYVIAGCESIGGKPEDALPGAVAVCLMHLSIVLVDDMLDADPKGRHHQFGSAETANLALALQALSYGLLDKTGIDAQGLTAIHVRLQQMNLRTAYGQHLDAGEVAGESDYWHIVDAKSASLPSSTLYLGAILGGSSLQTADQLGYYGALLGRSVQINDDVADALETPAKPDWQRQHNNLPILYALTVDHHHRNEFQALLPSVHEPDILQRAQQILVASGALSYCAYKLFELYQEAGDYLNGLSLPNPSPLKQLLEDQIQPMRETLTSLKIDLPALRTSS
jgi:geranylgeranyl pyrophosphate synthase